MKKLIAIIITTLILLCLSGCKKDQTITIQKENITLNYYKLFENEENLEPIFTEFKKKNPNISINYKKFVDPEKFLETIVDEIAEGGGPDIISVPNSWIKPNYKKISPAPIEIAPANAFRDIFVEIAASDNIISDNEGNEFVYGIPLSVDNLALYYNDEQFEQSIPEQGKPGTTWDQIATETQILTLKNFETNKIIRSGLAIGRGDNILRATDILMSHLLQNEVNIYNQKFNTAKLTGNSKVTETLNFITSFANEDNPERTWDNKIVSSKSTEKELESFITGKTSMIFGYSHLYKDLLNLSVVKQRQGIKTIEIKNIKIAKLPQIDPINSPATYAKYFTETVSRNSKHPNEAWKLLVFMTEKNNLQKLYKKSFKPTSRRDLIQEQKQNPIYSPFIEQIGYSKSIPQVNYLKFDNIFKELYTNYLNGSSSKEAIQNAEDALNEEIPNEGLIPAWSIN